MALRSKFLSVLGLLAAIAAFSLAAMAQDTAPTTPGTPPPPDARGPHRGPGGPEGRRGPGGRGDMMMGELRGINLTDPQKQQIHSILEANKPDESTMQEMHTLGIAVHDGSSTAEQQARLEALSQQVMAKRKQVHDQVWAVLTPEQIQQLDQRRQEMKDRWQQRQRQASPATPPAPPKPSN